MQAGLQGNGFIGNRSAKSPALQGAAARDEIPTAVDVAVVGAGVIGLSIAWRLAFR